MKRGLLLITMPFALLACEAGDHSTLATANLSYELASSGQTVAAQSLVSGPAVGTVSSNGSWSQPSVREAAALVNFIAGLRQAGEAYFAPLIANCAAEVAQQSFSCDPQQAQSMGLTCDELIEQQQEYKRLVCLGNETTAPDVAAGVAKMERLASFLSREAQALGQDKLAGEIALAEQILENIKNQGAAPPYRDWGMGGGNMPTAGAFDASAGAPAAPPTGNLGATPGGSQDIGYLRTVVEEGYVPLPYHLATEGLLSEHNLPLASARPCDQLLCVRTAAGLAPSLVTGKQRYYVQVGFSSNLKAETFKRAPLNLAVVLDKSGSMSGPAAENLSKMEAVKAALTKMVDRLNSNDRLAIVLFNSSPTTLLPSTPVTDRAAIKALIATIEHGGGTDIESGLEQGFEIVAQNSAPKQRLDRVMLLTDALPNVGRTGENSFLELTKSYAQQGIGLSTFGVGINFGQELVVEISRVRGGNYFFLEDANRIDEVFNLDFDYLVTPLAYDLQLAFAPGSWLKTVGVHGIPTWQEGQNLVQMNVATLFLSRNHGAIVIELEPKSSAGPPL